MRYSILGLSLAVLLAGAAIPAKAASEKEERTLTVHGQGKVSAIPDIATLSVEVQQDGAELDPAMTQVRKDMNRILDVLKKQEIAEKDIRTDLFQVTPKYEYDKRSNPKRVGFIVKNRVTVKVRDLKKTGKVLSAVLGAGATTVQGPNFEVDNPQEAEKLALAAAVRDAKAKAMTVADAAGVKLGEIILLNPQQIAWPMPRPSMMARSMMVAEAAAPEEPISSGEQTVTGFVTVQFAIH